MHLNFSILFTGDIIPAISWTLIHSLWQGMLLAIVAGIIIFFTKKTSAAFRGNLLILSLLMFITGIVATFCTMLLQVRPEVQMMAGIPVAATLALQPAIPLAPENVLSITGRAVNMLNNCAGWIVGCWLLIMMFRCVQIAAGLYGVHQLRRRETFSPGECWSRRLIVLSRQLKIKRPVKLLQSGIAVIPAVIGYFKPIILFPAGMLASLPPQQVEAILVHELAHIRRKDFLVNLMQYLVEIVFFFHPAIRWVSSQIRLERENSCDDIAVAQTGNARNYINALMAFQEAELHQALALGFTGEKRHLINRIKRIINHNNKTLDNMEKKLLAAGMVTTTIFIFAFSSGSLQQQAAEKNPVVEGANHQLIPATDTVPGKNKEQEGTSNATIIRSVNGKTYKLVTRNGRLTELYVNGKKIPAEKTGSYGSVTSKILKQSKVDAENSGADMQQAEEAAQEAKAAQEESEKEMAEAKEEMENSKLEMEEDMLQAKKAMEQSNMEMEQSAKEMDEAKVQMKTSKLEGRRDMQQAKRAMEQARLGMQQAKKEMERSRLQMEQSKNDMEHSKKLQESIVDDLIRENIIKDKKELTSYKLSNEELIVNGVKQPEAVHKKFKDNYIKRDNTVIMYDYSNKEEIK